MFPKPAKGTARKARHATRKRREQAFRDAVWNYWGVGGDSRAFCARCHREVTRGRGGEVDHVKPRSTHPELAFTPSNGRIVCAPCNRYLKTHPLEREA